METKQDSDLEPRKNGDVKKRGKYGRPCDVCAARRVRCVSNGGDKCVGCTNHRMECTNNRIRKKSGPKRIRRQLPNATDSDELQAGYLADNYEQQEQPEIRLEVRQESRQVFKQDGDRPLDDVFSLFLHPVPQYATIPVDKLLPYLQVYQTWFYGYWPVLSVAHLMLTFVDSTQMNHEGHCIQLTQKNAMSYALCCAVCSAIATQVSFVSNKDKVLNVQNVLPASVYAEEARRVRNLFDYSQEPSVLTLLSSFFLYAHYVNNKGRANQAIIYLREAIAISQVLGFHEAGSYEGKTTAEIHRCKKIYYMLLITERFMCFEDGMPVILDPCIEFPLLENEEYPSLLVGFTELIKVFSVPDKKFFGEINQKSGYNKMQMFRDYLENQGVDEKRRWIYDVQKKLGQPIESPIKISDSQKVNILLSQSWMKAIAWHITLGSGLLRSGSGDTDDCFHVDFPLKIARDFLSDTQDLPQFAFEANGPGICVKLLEIANSMTFALPTTEKKYLMADSLSSVFLLIQKFRNDVTLPLEVYHKVANLLSSYKRTVPRPLERPDPTQRPMPSSIEEIFDDDEASDAGHLLDDAATLPVTGLTPSFFAYPNMGQFSTGMTASPLLQVSQSISPVLLLLFLQSMGEMNYMAKPGIPSSLAQVMSSFMHPQQLPARSGSAEDPMGIQDRTTQQNFAFQ